MLVTIYKISCLDETVTECYIGSSINYIHRQYQHKNNCINTNLTEHNFKLYRFIRDNGGWNNWNFEVLETTELETRLDKIKLERYWYDQCKPTLNSYKPNRSKQEWKLDNPNYQRNYNLLNQTKIKQKRTEYYDKNKTPMLCECGGKYSMMSRFKHSQTKKHKSFILTKDCL